eukprot:309790-Amphidinium_carterae.1
MIPAESAWSRMARSTLITQSKPQIDLSANYTVRSASILRVDPCMWIDALNDPATAQPDQQPEAREEDEKPIACPLCTGNVHDVHDVHDVHGHLPKN